MTDAEITDIWFCWVCGAPIKRHPTPRLGGPRYAHRAADESFDHDAVRGSANNGWRMES